MRNAKILAASIILAALAGLAGCSDKAEQQQKAQQAALNQVMHQGNGQVRKWGQSGFVGFGPGQGAKPAAPASSGN